MNWRGVVEFLVIVAIVAASSGASFLAGYGLATSEMLESVASSMQKVDAAVSAQRALDLDVRRSLLWADNPYFANKSIEGMYDGGAKILWVKTSPRAARIFEDLLHEYAHAVFYQELSSSERSVWAGLWNESGSYVSAYARENAQEDFAETFAKGVECSWAGVNVSAKDAYMRVVVEPLLVEEGVLAAGAGTQGRGETAVILT